MATGAINIEERVRIPADVFDLRRFRAWAHSDEFPERGRISYIGGEIDIDMSPEELNTHARVKRDVSTDFHNLVRKHDLGEVHFDGTFLVNDAAGLATEPDLLFCTWDTIRSGRVRFVPWVEGSDRLVEVQGSPDLVCEIVSASSVRKDTVRLRETYFNAGIAEYWIIDARGKGLKFEILSRRRRGYVEVQADVKGYRHSPVLGRSVRLVRRRDRVGSMCYRLLSQRE
jgi:Uma2 family endonuclease